MKAKLIPVGNSYGVRIPKPIIEQCSLEGELDLTVENGSLVIRPLRKLRAGWTEAAKEIANSGEHALVMNEASGHYSARR